MNFKQLVGNRPIELNQGDDYPYSVAFNEQVTPHIKKVVFTCQKFGIEQEFDKLEYDNGRVVYTINLNNEITKNFIPTITTFDVTVYIKDNGGDDILSETGIRMVVKKKINPTKENINE